MKVEFEGQLVENLDQFWVNWQHLCYDQACEDWKEKKEVWEFIGDGVDEVVLDDFLKRNAGGVYMDRVFSKRIHKVPVPMKERDEKVYAEVSQND